ncbi:MAG: ATP-binding protein [Thermosynechococcaceae cyanobacterium MS004]|nr:ATP-binding protein [Thermosynechococcaceae cyanobacterium MS004]
MLWSKSQQLISRSVSQVEQWLSKQQDSLLVGYVLPTLGLGLMTFLWVKSQAIDITQHSRYTDELRQLQAIDARINQNILQTRLRILMFYDPIIAELSELKQLHQALKRTPTFVDSAENRALSQSLQEHVKVWQQKEALFQQFQAQNSILKNSLTYFPLAIAEVLQEPTTSPLLASALNQLLQDVLLLNLSPNDEDLALQINQKIERILANASRNPERPNISLNNAITHARIILQRRPSVATLTQRLMAKPTLQQSDKLFKVYERAYQRAINTTNLYRLGFYLLSTLSIIGIAASIILKLRASAIALQRSEQKYRTIFENSQVGIGRTRLEDGLFLDLNQRYADIMGFTSPTELIGTRFTSEFYVDLGDRNRILAELEHHGEVRSFEEQLRRADGSIVWVLLSLHPNPAEHCLDFVITDISDRKQAEEQLKQAMEAAKVANQAKSQFLSHMSHELRSPLNVILGFTQLIGRNTQLSPQQQNHIDTINRSGEHLLSLINNVLEMSKIESGRITLTESDFDLHELLETLQAMFQPKAEAKGLHLIFEQAANLPQYIHSDEGKLRQIFINLLSNAMKFTQRGRIVLRSHLREAEPSHRDPDIPPTLAASGLRPIHLSFTVEDTGPGIAPNEVNRLFEPFMQTEVGHRFQEGTGLGLAISRQFVQILGGDITVESQVKVGSCFQFTILAHEAQAVKRPIPGRKVIGLAADQPSYRILVVEDKADNRQLLVELLQSVGFEVQEATNGQEALDCNQHWHPHLIWMDLRMPGLDGYEATRQIKILNPPSPVIIALTGSAFEEEQAYALSLGCDDFMRKPFHTEAIFEKLAEYLGVRYRYAEAQDARSTEKSNSAHQDGTPRLPEPLTPADLATMPPDWVHQVYQAATRVNTKLLLAAIAQIPDPRSNLAISLTQLVRNCHFEDIVALTQPQS